MATKHISGIKTEKVEINSSGHTWVLDKNAAIVSADYGLQVGATANNTVINIDGSVNAAIAVLGQADKLKVNVGAGGDVMSQIGLMMAGTKEFTANIDGDVFAIQYGVSSAAKKMQVDVGKSGSVEGGAYGIYSTGTGRFTANIDGEVDGGQIGLFAVGEQAKVAIGKGGSIEGGAYGLYSVGTESFAAKIFGELYGGQYGLNVVGDKTELTVAKGGSIEGGVFGVNSMGTGRFTAKIDGDVFGGQLGILSAAEKGKIEIGKGVTVEGGNYGVFMPSSIDVEVVNRGTIAGVAGFGIGLGAGAEIRNFGDIFAVGGISASGDDIRIVNEDGGSIHGTVYGMVAGSAAGQSSKLTNHGLIVTSEPSGIGMAGGNGDDSIINDGRVYGIIAAGGGNDKIDLRGGLVKGDIQGGDGDDTLITDKASHKLVEMAAQGTDTVKSSVNYTLQSEVEKLFLTGDKDIDGKGGDTANELHGNKGDNVLRGMAGMDELFGGKGVDRLFGGDDADIFHFSTGDGKDTIADLVTTLDDVDLSGWNAVQDFNDVLDNAKNDGDGNVVIKAGNDSLTILGMEKGDLDMNDFTF